MARHPLSNPPVPRPKKRKHLDASPSTQKTKRKRCKKSSALHSDLGEFRVVNATIVLPVPPIFANNLRAGVEEMLDSMVMRYVPSLQGVLLAHSNTRFLSNAAAIHNDCPFAICNVAFDATVWSPRIAMKLVGKVKLCSPDHVSLLVHRIFNVSIPRHHVPQDQWVFEYGPAENDPEFGTGRDQSGEADAVAREGEETADMQAVPGNDDTNTAVDQEVESSGRWVHHLTGERLGAPDGYLEFTVIGLTVANEMLSLQGSIQPDPFSTQHVPRPPNSSSASSRASLHPHMIPMKASASALPEPSVPVVSDEVDRDSEEGGEEKMGEGAVVDLVPSEHEEVQKQKRGRDHLKKKAKKRKRQEEDAARQKEESKDGNSWCA